MEGKGRGKARQFDEDGYKDGRKRDEKRKPAEKSVTRSKSKPTHSADMDDHAHQNNRYHQREVPPRFQQQKQTKFSQKHVPKTNQAVKKPSKETPRWTSDSHAHTPSQDHTHSISTGSSNDGGWSTGPSAKGSGWRKTNSESSSLNEWGQSKKSLWDESGGVWESEGKTETDGWGHNGHGESGWGSDQDEGSSRSQSPGGVVMVVKQTTPSKENSSSMWDSKPVGSNWKMHTLDTKPADEMEKNRSSEESGSATGGSQNSSTEKELALPEETELYRSSPIKPQAQISSSLSGKSTPTQEMGGVWRSGRTSANSTSSLTEVNGMGKVNVVKVGQQSRSSSPRKMNRYDQTPASSNSLGRGVGPNLLRPRKSINELEGGLESLHNVPSGWGELPSPKTNDTDKGTEFWGIPPDDLAKMSGAETPPIINGWNGGSRSPNPKVPAGDFPAESANWPPPTESAGKSGWADEKLPSSEAASYYDTGSMTPAGSEPHPFPTSHSGLDATTPPTHVDTSYPHKPNRWNSTDDSKVYQNQLMVKDLVLRYQQLKQQLSQMQSSGNVQSLQKSLSQQLTQAQTVRQKLLCQAPSGGVSPPQPLKIQLSRTEDIISSLKQHINQSQQMSGQQTPFSPRVKIEMRQSGHAHFPEPRDMSAGIRDMSLNQRPQGIQQSRSASKLHRLISSQEDESPFMSNPPPSPYSSNAPFSPSFRSASATTLASSLLASKPVHQIQEFKPGVLWQPKKSDMSSSIKYSDQFQSGSGGGGVQRSMSLSGNSFGGPSNRFMPQPQQQRFNRSQSTDNNYYGNQSVPRSGQGDLPWTGNEGRPQNFPSRGWNGGRVQRPGRISLPATPVGAFPEHQAGWRQPPSTLLPKQDYQYKHFESTRRGSRSTPIDAHQDWFPETPTSADPVWGSGVSLLDQGAWPQQHKSGQGWSQSERLKEPFTPSSESKWSSDSVFSDWQPGNKTRLKSSGGPALSPWLVIRTSSPQLNMQCLKDACKGYGDVKSFIEGSEFVLVSYNSVDETVQAKAHIDSLWGAHASTEVVPEGEMDTLWQQINEPSKPNPPSTLHSSFLEGGQFNKWEEQSKPTYGRQASTPGGSSVWSDGGFLSGISSPWSSEFSGTLTSPSTGYHSDEVPSVTATPDDRLANQGPSALSSYLPNGLL